MTAKKFVCSLAAKPFVILTGNSGTGKTKLAELFVSWLLGSGARTASALVAVGADWTDNRNVVGFVNHLRTASASASLPVYQSTTILNVVLEAEKEENKTRPFFLILDEMNLSHVERYFADFLSAMESTDGTLHLHREGQALPNAAAGVRDVPETLPFPRNLFVIGTVNVDETTYMFSPKVLDRANVIEFRVAVDAPAAFLASGGKAISRIDAAPAGYAEQFLELSYRARSINDAQPLTLATDLSDPPSEAGIKNCRNAIGDLFALMQQRRQEFAFRTMAEILRFLAVDYELTADEEEWDWSDAMDAQILQKILPKLHGSKRKIGSLLSALAKYCESGNRADAEKMLSTETQSDAYSAEGAGVFAEPRFKDSHRKLCEMIVTLRRDQFVSFIQ